MLNTDSVVDRSVPASRILATVRRIAAVEVWERFSFYSMNLLLPLFLVAQIGRGGFGWSAAAALRFGGAYIAIVQFLPVLGGYVADRWLGGRRALTIGAWCMLFGHLLLCGPHVIPLLASRFTGEPAHSIQVGDVEFGHFTVPAPLRGAPAAAYLGITGSFFVAIGLIAMGNGFFKPALAAMLGRLPHPNGASRDAAYVILFRYVHIGAIGASLGSGWVAQTFGWQWAFGSAGVGMAIALVLMRRLRFDDLIDDRTRPDTRSSPTAALERSKAPASFVGPVALLLTLAILFYIGDYQVVGLVDVFAQQSADRTIFGFEIPATWFVGFNPLLIVLLAPLLTRLTLQNLSWQDFGVGRKIGCAFLLTAVAFLMLWAAYRQSDTGQLAHPMWIVGCVASLTMGELLVAPLGAAAVSRLAPPRQLGLILGTWYAANGLGGWLSGLLGAAVIEGGEPVLFVTAVFAIALGLVLFLAQPVLRRLRI